MSDHVLDTLKEIIAKDLDVNVNAADITPKIPLFEEGLALDSVVLVELISFVEKRLGVEFRDEHLNTETFWNLESIAAVVQELRAPQPA